MSQRIAIMAPGLNLLGDAVSNDVLGMYSALSETSVEASINVPAPMRSYDLNVQSYDDVLSLSPKDIAIYHYCTGDRDALEVLTKTKATVVLKYHNVTPSHFFNGYCDEYKSATAEALEMLGKFANIPGALAMADSDFNKQALLRRGMPEDRVSVVPPFHQTDSLLAHKKPPQDDGIFHVLSVGRIAPNKNLETLLESFADGEKKSDRSMTLHIVGTTDPRLLGYRNKLVRIHKRRGPISTVYHNGASTEMLAGLYSQCSAYMTCSEHEGFCVPAIEAMAFGLPIIATKGSALTETCGDAALLESRRKDFTNALLMLTKDDALRADLGARGGARYEQHFANEVIRKKFLSFVRGFPQVVASNIAIG
ncbi:glycosyltransferase family 4 protein [Nitratireductor sp. GCM10026969]|uniref:glycosyltransferase family 4 protein n=1 Tax=Nitratireductor sp. GCM10026969 TaxID=3252645 RepID=UPI00360F2322